MIRRCWLAACLTVATATAAAAPSALIDGCNQQARYALIQSPIHFDSATTALPTSAQPVLQRLAEIALQCPDTEMVVRGHTDNRGDAHRNVALSLARARAVADAIAELGIAAQRIRAEGWGSREPVDDNATRRGRRNNRRITVSFEAGGQSPKD